MTVFDAATRSDASKLSHQSIGEVGDRAQKTNVNTLVSLSDYGSFVNSQARTGFADSIATTVLPGFEITGAANNTAVSADVTSTTSESQSHTPVQRESESLFSSPGGMDDGTKGKVVEIVKLAGQGAFERVLNNPAEVSTDVLKSVAGAGAVKGILLAAGVTLTFPLAIQAAAVGVVALGVYRAYDYLTSATPAGPSKWEQLKPAIGTIWNGDRNSGSQEYSQAEGKVKEILGTLVVDQAISKAGGGAVTRTFGSATPIVDRIARAITPSPGRVAEYIAKGVDKVLDKIVGDVTSLATDRLVETGSDRVKVAVREASLPLKLGLNVDGAKEISRPLTADSAGRDQALRMLDGFQITGIAYSAENGRAFRLKMGDIEEHAVRVGTK